MINMAVLNLKDIVKYLIKFTVVIAVVIGLTKYFSTARVNVAQKAEEIEGVSFVACLDTTIPGIANDKRNTNVEKEKSSILETMLHLNLGMINSIKDNDHTDKNQVEENKQKNNTEETTNQVIDEPLQKAETGLETEVQKTNVPEKYTSEYKGVKVKNETEILFSLHF